MRAFSTHGFVRSRGPTVPKCFTYPQRQLIDATVIGSASKDDKEAAWVRHRTRVPAHGYKAHIPADKDSGIFRDVETTPANEPDVAIAPAIIPDHLKTPLSFSLDAMDRACQSQTVHLAAIVYDFKRYWRMQTA